MLTYGVPTYRLKNDIALNECHAIEHLGAKIFYNMKVGRDITLADLQQKYDAIFIGVGLWKSRDLPIPGADAPDIIRGIEYLRGADAIYDAGGADAVVGGRGWWRVLTKYKGDRSFDQVLTISPIADFTSVVADPDYQEPDGSDRCGAFVTETVSMKAFEAAWPGATAVDWSKAGEVDNHWFEGPEKIVIADYYERVRVARKLVMLSDGTIYVEGVDDPPVIPPGVTRVREREFDDWKVRWFKLAGGQQILAEYAWKGGTIVPVICCVGNEIVVDGKRRYWGLIRFARDPQRMYNFAQSTIAEAVALSPKAPFMVAEGQDEG